MMKIPTATILIPIALMLICGCQNQTKNEHHDNDSGTKSVSKETKKDDNSNSFEKTLRFEGISFQITTGGTGSLKQLSIQSKGLDNDLGYQHEIDGTIADAQVADLNADGFPELLIFTKSAGSGSYGNVIAFSANNKKSMSQVNFPATSENSKLKNGYMGHDKFMLDQSTLIQEFPIYKEEDPNSKPSGGIRRVEYKLVNGEASRKFVVAKISESASK
jgi:Periplasmic lysozyme inhibitor of I-type lysozyme